MNIKHTNEALLKAVAVAVSWAEVCRLLGVRSGTGNQTHFKRRAVLAGANFSHFTGRAWLRGKINHRSRINASEYLAIDGKKIKSHELKMKLIRDGFKAHKCEGCGLSEWMGHPIPIELHHRNGRPSDNRLDNIQILCHNCHAQTDTFAGKNINHLGS